MEAELQSLIDAQELTPDLAKKLLALSPGSCCRHKSWGTGKITTWDTALKRMSIDFVGKHGHSMEFQYAATSLKPLEDGHIEARVMTDPAAVKAQADSDPVALLKNAVASLGKEATPDRIEAVMVPAIIPATAWKKWWEAAKRAMKKDPHFVVPSKRTEAIGLLDAPADNEAQALESLTKSVGIKAKSIALEEITRHWKSIQNKTSVEEVLTIVDTTLAKVPSSQEALGLELHLSRLEFLEAAGRAPDPERLLGLFSSNPRDMVALIEQLPGARQARCLERVLQAKGPHWPETAALVMPHANSRLAEVIIRTFREAGREEEIITLVTRLVRERSLNHDFLIWLGRNRKSPMAAPLINVDLFYVILTVLEFDQMGGTRKAGRLSDYLLSDKGFLADMLADASEDQVRDVVRALMLTAAYDELDKRSLLAALVKLYPFVQSMITRGEGTTGKSESSSQSLIVSWISLERRRAELEEIVNKKIPENSKEIGVARSYGDLRENHEFKAAKEMQNVLMRRKAELEAMLVNAQGTDFADVQTDEVNIGTTVDLEDIQTGEKLEYTIYGAWDSAPQHGVISYMTPVAAAMLKKKIGDDLPLTLEDGGTRRVKITAISKARVPVPAT